MGKLGEIPCGYRETCKTYFCEKVGFGVEVSFRMDLWQKSYSVSKYIDSEILNVGSCSLGSGLSLRLNFILI